jgi:hypothetical protein
MTSNAQLLLRVYTVCPSVPFSYTLNHLTLPEAVLLPKLLLYFVLLYFLIITRFFSIPHVSSSFANTANTTSHRLQSSSISKIRRYFLLTDFITLKGPTNPLGGSLSRKKGTVMCEAKGKVHIQ